MAEEGAWREEFRVRSEALLDKVKEVVHEGNVRKVIVKNDKGETVMELPLTFGVVGAVAAPVVAAIGAIAALASHWTIEVERTAPAPRSKKPAAAKAKAKPKAKAKAAAKS